MSTKNLYLAGQEDPNHNNNTTPSNPPPNTNNPDLVTFPSSRPGHSVTAGHDLLRAPSTPTANTNANATTANRVVEFELMGPILRRQKVQSVPLGAGGDFFYTAVTGGTAAGPHRSTLEEYDAHHALPDFNHHQQPSTTTTTTRRGRQRGVSYDPNRVPVPRQKQSSYQGPTTTTTTTTTATTPPSWTPTQQPQQRTRQRQTTPQQQGQFMRGLLRRRQISLDLLGPNDFFGVPEDDDDDLPAQVVPPSMTEEDEDEEGLLKPPPPATDTTASSAALALQVPATWMEEEEEEGTPEDQPAEKEEEEEEDDIAQQLKSLFFPLRFAPRQVLRSRAPHEAAHGGSGTTTTSPAAAADQEQQQQQQQQLLLQRYQDIHAQVQQDLLRLSKMDTIPEETSRQLSALLSTLESVPSSTRTSSSVSKETTTSVTSDTTTTTTTNGQENATTTNGETEQNAMKVQEEDDDNDDGRSSKEENNVAKPDDDDDDDDDPTILRAGRADKIKAGICFVVMLVLTLIVTLWETHLNDEAFILTPVGLACVTDCPGNLTTRDFFQGHSHFEERQVIDLILNLDANVVGHAREALAVVDIVGVDTGHVKATHAFGPPGKDERHHFQHKLVVDDDFDHPHEEHIVNVRSSVPDVDLSFTLLADVQQPLSDYSVIVAAVLMVFVYVFILLEVIHRTLISIFGSMIALMFFFVMEGGHVESIKIIMLHLEWSTLGLLFGMMLIVGELSHTGVFEWCAVRILIFSKGSYVRLLVLLATLTAVASAFLDNVTTMLLVAPVTIDMCHIVGDIDPRPYLIAEVLLSNVGGTATLIGDPPNIIIGSAFSDIIGFIDFIAHLMPVIFLFCIPATLVLVVYLYRWYLTSSKMRVLDTALLKKTYRIYDEPRLLISGIVTAFVILMFFLHPVHHKDTAWIALLGALVTVRHHVQDC